MAEAPFFSSQNSDYERYKILEDEENTDALLAQSQRPKRPPTVTPKRFKKFFTPRASLSSRNKGQTRSARHLKDITRNGANRRRRDGSIQNPVWDAEKDENNQPRPPKRRKHSIDIASSPPQSSPLKHMQTSDEIKIFEDSIASPDFSDEEELPELPSREQYALPIRRLRQSSQDHRLLSRSFGGFDAVTSARRRYEHCADWRSETADFVSTHSDLHIFNGTALPFCTASCNTNSLVAIGEEEGGIRLIDSSASSKFSKAHVIFRPHNNAIMDLTFSADDYLLATASGDQTSRIVDMHTQKTICILSGHKSSVKQVRFQPGDGNMLTTSSRDGSVLLWDMRCGNKGSMATLRSSFARNVDNHDLEPNVRYSKYSLDPGTAHRATKNAPVRASTSDSFEMGSVSITAIEHVPNGRDHLLVTTCEINSSIKVWDLRNVSRRTSNALLSSISPPQNHNKTRHHGINSIVFSSDGARLYAACRDATVYVYSTNHLVLGHAPELSLATSTKARSVRDPKTGLGPLYGLKHPSLKMGSFYIKAALRPARGDRSEMLALGSSDDCAVLFPTDERYLPERERPVDEEYENDDQFPSLPGLRSQTSKLEVSNGIPIHSNGTALIRGHDKEVTSLTWTHDGELVTVGDNYMARCWRENREEAQYLRNCGEGGGVRFLAGWADMEAEWDVEEE